MKDFNTLNVLKPLGSTGSRQFRLDQLDFPSTKTLIDLLSLETQPDERGLIGQTYA